MRHLYRIATLLLGPLVYLYLRKRERMGKEDPKRLKERLGYASFQRPQGPLVWIHAASVGESNSVMPLLQRLTDLHPNLNILITTGTVSSARLLQPRLSERVYHHFVPVDTRMAVRRFLKHWKPDLAIWVESELWPNLILDTYAQGCPMVLLNARMSDRSYMVWQQFRFMIRELLSCFRLILAQSEDDARKLRHLGANNVKCIGNLKFDAPPLVADSKQTSAILAAVGDRPIWLASSTHPGEEIMIADVHKSLKDHHPDLLTIIVPRHSERGGEIAQEMQARGLRAAQRSKEELIAPDTDVYVADTMGELGIFYRLSSIVFIGGSLVPHGGQNPLEAARLDCVVVCGPHMDNFADICSELVDEGGLLQVEDSLQLGKLLGELLANDEKQEALAQAALKVVQEKQGIVGSVIAELEPYLTPMIISPDIKQEVAKAV